MSDYTPTTDEIVEAVVYHQTRKGFDGMGAVGREVAVLRVANWLAEDRAQARREAVAEFAKQHGIGDLESRPLYDAQQQLADAKSEIEHLRTVERRLKAQVINAKAEALREAADAFEVATINVTLFGDSPEAKWWEVTNTTRKRLIASMRARADKLEGK